MCIRDSLIVIRAKGYDKAPNLKPVLAETDIYKILQSLFIIEAYHVIHRFACLSSNSLFSAISIVIAFSISDRLS